MAIRTALLTSKNINLDTDFSKYIETVSEPGVIEGLAVTASSVATGIAWVLCERTNGETIYSLVQNFNAVSISGDGYVIISIPQNIVDNGGGNEDGTGIASIEVVNELPAKNYLLLATISGGTVTDNRNMIKKVWELSTEIDSIFAQLEDLDQRVDKLEAADAIDHLEERALVWENYALTDTLFKQLTPKLADSTVEANVGDVAANTQIHIQRLGSGTASNELKLKLKSAGSPTTGLTVEVRKWVKVNVSSSEAYWYGNEVIATGTIVYGDISNDWSEITVTLDNEFGGTEWELLDIVLYQTGSIVNASNYYIMACDSTQWSEWFSYVSVNGTTRTRKKLMPYCVSDWFAQAMLSKVNNSIRGISFTNSQRIGANSFYTMYSYTVQIAWKYKISITYRVRSQDYHCRAWYRINWGDVVYQDYSKSSNTTVNWFVDLNVWDIVDVWGRSAQSRSESDCYFGSSYIDGVWLSNKPLVFTPDKIKAIWEYLNGVIFWIDKNNNIILNGIVRNPQNEVKEVSYTGTSSDITTFYGYIVIKVGNKGYRVPISSSTVVNYDT